jgi:hypothetical protein
VEFKRGDRCIENRGRKFVILSAHQPAYLPWLGYLEKIARADMFVFLDTVQFEKNSYINRNKIRTPHGVQWLTIPVKTKGHITSTLRDTSIDDAQPWRNKHLKSIEANYGKAAHFKDCFPRLEKMFSIPESNLAELCWQQLQMWLNEFEIGTTVIRSSELSIKSRKSNLMLDICEQLGASQYLSGILGRRYLDEEAFRLAGIKIEYQDFQHPIYTQIWGDFVPYMGVVDYWMNCGAGPFRGKKET